MTGTATITGAGTLDFEGQHSVTPALVSIGGVTVGGLAALTTPSVQVGALVVQGNLVLGPTAPLQPQVLNSANTLTVTSGASLDLTNTDLIVHSGSAATVRGEMALGEIHSSSAITNLTGLGYVSGTDYLTLYGALGKFDGTAVSAADLLIRFTYLGDADLSGTITMNDYALLEAGFFFGHFNGNAGNNPASWVHGDFNYDGLVNYQDYALIDNAFHLQSGTLANDLITQHAQEFGTPYTQFLTSLSTPVPEPASRAVLIDGSILIPLTRAKTMSQ